METTESGVLLGWIALGEAAPVAALAIVCLLCASIVAVVLGGLSALGPDTSWISRISERTRSVAALFAAAGGAIALGFMLQKVEVSGFHWFYAVGLYCATMVGFVATQFALVPRPGAATASDNSSTPKITVRPAPVPVAAPPAKKVA